MANYNLTGQEIRNTYEQLGQVSGSIEGGVSGSAIVDGTGSRINTLHVTASQATSASHAIQADSASFAPNNGVTSIIAGTGISVDQATGAVTVTNTEGALATGSLLVTASNVDAIITYTKGDGSTFTNTINNVANATEAEDLVITVKNTSGGTLAKGTAVHAVSVTGENVDVIAASNDSASAMPAIGVLSQEIANSAAGTCIIAGRDIGLDTSGLTAGASVYVGIAGALTATKPTGTALIQNIGTAAKIDASDGEIIVQGSGRTNDLPNITAGYAWVGDSNGVPQAVATSSFSTTAFPFTGNAQITGSLVVSGSGLSSGEDVFVLGFPRTGGNSLQGVIRSTIDDGLHLYGNKNFNNGGNTFGGGQVYFEAGPINVGSAGSPVSLDMQNGSAITASNGTLPISGNVDIDGTVNSTGNHTITSQFPTYQANGDSGLGSIYAGYQIADASTTANTNFAVSTFTGLDGSNPVFELIGPGTTRLLWSSANFPYLHVPQLLKAQSGAQITGSLDVSGAITGSSATFTSASIGYLQTVTGSATIIGDQYIVLNADSPTARFAGLKVYDSGSGLTGSFEWDSVDDNWIQVETGGESAGMLTGASGSKGSETYPSNNTLLKGTGNHTVVDSIITDDGTTATVTGALLVTGSQTLTGSLDVDGDTEIIGTVDLTGSINLQASGTSNAIEVFPSTTSAYVNIGSTAESTRVGGFKVYNDSGINGTSAATIDFINANSGSSYHRATLGQSDFTGLDGTNPVFHALSAIGSNNYLWWTSENYPYLNVPAPASFTAPVSASAVISASGGIIGDLTGTATSASYAPTNLADANTWTNTNTFNSQVKGGVTSLAIASTTASMDFTDGNFFTLTLANGVDTHLDAANVSAGQTITLTVTNNATAAGTLSFSPDFKFAGGTAPTVTATVDAVDILTFVTTDATDVYGTGLLNFS